MPTFTGYEPNNSVGKGPGNVPITMGASGTAQTQQLVPAETLDADLSNLMNESMLSLEDFLDEPLVPLSEDFIVESGPKGLANSRKNRSGKAVDAPKDVGHHGASSSLKQARFSADCKPKDFQHHGKPAKQARFSEQLVSFEPDDLQSGTKVLAPISDSGKPKDDGHHGNPPLDDFQSTSQSSCSSGSKGLAQPLSPYDSTVASTDAIVTADRMVNLESEIARLRRALDAKDIELLETKVHAENYASKALRDSRNKAEKALAFQKGSFEEAHAEYSMTLRDICESEVARSTADLEAIANSVIGQQQQ